LKTRIATLACPIPVAGFAKGHIAIGIILAERVFLATSYILRPVTCMCFLIVQKASNAELLSGSAIPAGPVPGARCLMTKDTIEPVAVISADRWIMAFSVDAVDAVWVVTNIDEARTAIACVDEAIGAGSQNGIFIGA